MDHKEYKSLLLAILRRSLILDITGLLYSRRNVATVTNIVVRKYYKQMESFYKNKFCKKLDAQQAYLSH